MGDRAETLREGLLALAGGTGLQVMVAVPSYELSVSTELLGRMAMEKMLGELSSRPYRLGLEPVGERVEQAASATSKSSVSGRFVTVTRTALAELMAADLIGIDLVALIVGGVRLAEHTCTVALGITATIS